MTWYAWLVVAYLVLDRLLTVAWVGRSFAITPAVAVANVVTGGLIVWATVSLAT